MPDVIRPGWELDEVNRWSEPAYLYGDDRDGAGVQGVRTPFGTVWGYTIVSNFCVVDSGSAFASAEGAMIAAEQTLATYLR